MEPLVLIEATAVELGMHSAESRGGPESAVLADSIGTVAVRGRLLVETLLQDARFAERPPELTTVRVADVVTDALTLVMTHGSRPAGPQITVGRMPTVVSNAQLLSIVIRNLVVNAVKYGSREAGDIRIFADDEQGGWRLSVVSRGRAISPGEVERIFRRFERGNEPRRSTGTGLGLAICARLVGRLGGMLGVTPEPGVGNRFFVFLPDAEAPEALDS